MVQGLEIALTEAKGEAHQCVISLHLRAEDDESPVTQTLKDLGDQVTEVLDQFG